MSNVNYALWAFAAGILIPVMATCNGSLSRLTGNPTLAMALLFAIGLVCSLGIMIFTGTGGGATLLRAPPWMFCGGVIVCFYVFSVSVLAPRFGVGNTILFVVAAQIVTSAMIDQFGWFGAIQRPLSPLRMAGIAVFVAGLVLTQLADRKT